MESQQQTLDQHLQKPPDAFLDPLRRGEWKMVDIDETYVPPVGYTAIDGTELVMKPKTAAFSGNILAWVAPCGRGKSSMVRRFEKAMFGPVGG